MALIQCKNCGNAISDRASSCPHCGVTLESLGSDDYSPYNEPASGGNNNLKVMAIVLALLAVLIVIGCGWFLYNRNQQIKEQERLAQIEQARQDSIAAAEQARHEAERAEQARQDSIRDLHNAIVNAYIYQLRDLRNSKDGEGGDYFLHDITGDGIPEIWMTGGFGYCELNIYTYRNGSLSNIGSGAGRHASYHRGKDYVIENFSLQGCQKVDRLTYNGSKVVATTIYEGEMDFESGEFPDYKEIAEPEFNRIPLTNEAPIRSIFQQ